MTEIDWKSAPAGRCLVGGSPDNHRGRVLRLMAMPDLPDATEPLEAPAKMLELPEAWACEGHYRLVREFLDRHTQPRRMAYRDGRPVPD
jgi:hypothetical protein